MRKRQAAFVAGSLLFATAALASPENSIRSEVEVTRSDIQADRKVIVAEALPLTDAQAKGFWPVYNAYRTELNKLGDRLVNLVMDFGKNYDTLTDAQAAKYNTDLLSIQKEIAATKAKYQSKFTAVIPAKLVLRFYQIENKLDTIVMLDATAGIPLAK
jgi:hypothetical protein